MKELRQLVAQSVYADEAYFSDQLLLPALAEGHHVTLVTAFVPSYLMRLVEDLASSPEIEPGKLTVILCVPFSSSEAVSEARLLSRYISLSGASLTEAKTLLESAADLALEGSLRLGALFSKQDQLLTPSCLGIIESGVPGSSEMVSLVDSTPGDLNSPIAIQGSWEPSLETLDKILRVVVAALNKEFPNLLRKSHQQVFELIRQIRDKGLVKQDFLQEPDQPAGTLKSKPHDSTKPLSNPVVPPEEDVLEPGIEQDDFAIERILREVFLREAGFEGEDVAAFLGEAEFTDLFNFDPSERQHTPPLSLELVEVVGHGYASCWCGESFDREQGCPDRYY